MITVGKIHFRSIALVMLFFSATSLATAQDQNKFPFGITIDPQIEKPGKDSIP